MGGFSTRHAVIILSTLGLAGLLLAWCDVIGIPHDALRNWLHYNSIPTSSVAAFMFADFGNATARLEPPGGRVREWSPPPGDLTQSTVSMVQPIVQRALHPWRHGITAQHLAAAVEAARVDGECCRVIVDRATIFAQPLLRSDVTEYSSAVRHRLRTIFQRLQLLLLQGRLQLNRTVEMVVCAGDGIASQENTEVYHLVRDIRGASRGPTPAFTHVKCRGSANIPLVYLLREGNWTEWAQQVAHLQNVGQSVPYTGRLPVAVFRGGSGTYVVDAFDDGQSMVRGERGGRGLLEALARTSDKPHLFDIKLGGEHYLTLLDQQRYKLMIYAEGNSGWADRFKLLALLGSGVIMQETMCKEWYLFGFEPWVHYLPVDYRFSNLQQVIEWALAHDTDVQQLISNMHAAAQRLVTVDATTTYIELLLRQYAALLKDPVRIPADVLLVDEFVSQYAQP